MAMSEKKLHAFRSSSPTSFDVARKAGVSQAAVSYVFNGQQNRHVSEATREKILKAARRREIDVVLVWGLDRWGRSDDLNR